MYGGLNQYVSLLIWRILIHQKVAHQEIQLKTWICLVVLLKQEMILHLNQLLRLEKYLRVRPKSFFFQLILKEVVLFFFELQGNCLHTRVVLLWNSKYEMKFYDF